MSYQNLKFEIKNKIAYVTINRPDKLNALNMATMEELRAAFTAIRDDKDVRVAILTGEGQKAFVAGADIGELSKHTTVSAKEYTHKGQAVLDLIENLGKPVIACINGFALGGGCELAMAGDIMIASDNAKFGQPEVNLGLIPGYGGSQRTTRLVGRGMAMYLCLTGEIVDAAEALRIGLVQKVVPQADLLTEAKRIANLIAGKAPLAIAACKRVINDGAHLATPDALELEAAAFGDLVTTSDFKEGTGAFLEKRKPEWTST